MVAEAVRSPLTITIVKLCKKLFCLIWSYHPILLTLYLLAIPPVQVQMSRHPYAHAVNKLRNSNCALKEVDGPSTAAAAAGSRFDPVAALRRWVKRFEQVSPGKGGLDTAQFLVP